MIKLLRNEEFERAWKETVIAQYEGLLQQFI
jgi:hypothetical protein